MRYGKSTVAILFSVTLAACATAPPARTNAADACADPMYLRLKAIYPDSLSEREFIRLRDLETACRAQQTTEHHSSGGMMRGSRAWLLMPAMMLLGGAMGLMMGWW